MAVVTIDAKGELEALQAEADGAETGTARETKTAEPEKAAETPSDKATDKTQEADADDVEGDDGLTPREKQDLLGAQRKDLPHSVQRVIAKRVAQRKSAEEFAAAQYAERKLAEQRAQAVERELAELKAKAAPAVVEQPEAGKPQRDKFDSDEKFWEAMTDWRVDQKLAKKAQDDAREAAERRQAEILETAKSRIGKALELVPDFEAVTKAADIEVPPVVAGYMQKSEMFAELGYHLAKHPKILESLARLPPDEQLVTIGKIEGSLKPFAAAEAKAAKDSDGATPSKSASTDGQRSQAAPGNDTGTTPGRGRDTAPVIRPLNGSGASPAEVAPQDMNIRETIHDWEKKHQANFGLRRRH
jgi:hypothetical protein